MLELRCHRSVVDKAAKADLNVWLADLALRANTAADTNDWAAVFGFARLLKSPHDKPHTSIFHEDGSTITESELIAERWHRHWVKFFRADTCSYRSLAAEQAKDAVGPHRMEDAVVDDVFAIIKGANEKKATGPDDLHIASWKAGGWAAAYALTLAENSMRRSGRAALLAKGGRIMGLWKHKGDRRDPDNSRGLLVQSFTGKVHSSLVKDAVSEPYAKAISEAQCGAVPGRSTSQASAIRALHADYATSNGKCFAQLFVDLSSAFDSVVRELCTENGDGSVDPAAVERLCAKHGLPPELRDLISGMTRGDFENPLLRAGADPGAVAMLKDLHNHTWFSVGESLPGSSDEVIATSIGGGAPGMCLRSSSIQRCV